MADRKIYFLNRVRSYMELPIDTSDDETPNESDSVPGGWVCEEFKPKLGVKQGLSQACVIAL